GSQTVLPAGIGRRPGRDRAPARLSLDEMPEPNFDRVKVARNPYAKRVAAEGISLAVGRGRPRRGHEVGPTTPKSVRFPPQIWERLETCARAQDISVHAAIRSAVIQWLRHAG